MSVPTSHVEQPWMKLRWLVCLCPQMLFLCMMGHNPTRKNTPQHMQHQSSMLQYPRVSPFAPRVLLHIQLFALVAIAVQHYDAWHEQLENC